MGRQRHHHNQCQERRQPVQNVQQVFGLMFQPVPMLPSERVRIALYMLGDLADPRIEKARLALTAYHYEHEAAVAKLMNEARRSTGQRCPVCGSEMEPAQAQSNVWRCNTCHCDWTENGLADLIRLKNDA